jgi:hypothetical protein
MHPTWCMAWFRVTLSPCLIFSVPHSAFRTLHSEMFLVPFTNSQGSVHFWPISDQGS